MTRRPPHKIPEWFWNDGESKIINFIMNHKESDICRDVLLNNKFISYSASMLGTESVMITIIYEDRYSLKNDYIRSIFSLSDYLDFYKIEYRKKKINKIVNNL